MGPPLWGSVFLENTWIPVKYQRQLGRLNQNELILFIVVLVFLLPRECRGSFVRVVARALCAADLDAPPAVEALSPSGNNDAGPLAGLIRVVLQRRVVGIKLADGVVGKSTPVKRRRLESLIGFEDANLRALRAAGARALALRRG